MVATACSAAPHSVCRPGEAGARLFAAIKHQLVSRSQKGRHLAPCSGSAGVSVVDAATAAADAPADVWASFADSVSGEYEGVTATFNPDGNPEPLPEYYVPQAYRDWGVDLHDWQSQCSVVAGDGGLTATTRRLMPTVGCEADAVAFTQEGTDMFAPGGAPATVAPSGGYSHGPLLLSSPRCTRAALEACLVLAPKQRRLRLVHNMRRRAADDAWQLDGVELHHERYDSPYRGKVELAGCGGGLKGFATAQRLAPEALQGPWVAAGLRYVVDAASGRCEREAVCDEGWSVEGLGAGTPTLHPLAAWSACSLEGEDVCVAAGVALEEGAAAMAVVVRMYRAGSLARVDLLTLARAPCTPCSPCLL